MTTTRPPRRALLWTLSALALLLPLAAWTAAHQADNDDPFVRLEIRYTDNVEKHFTRLPFREGMTVLDAMNLADDWPRGIDFQHRGRNATAFLTSIDALENEGGRGQRRNWLFSVNDEPADRSFGVVALQPGDVVRWEYRSALPEQ